MTIRIVTDSTCDLPPEIIKRLKISVVPCYINIGEQSYRDNLDISRREFYQGMQSCSQRLKTSAPGVGLFSDIYEQLAAEGVSQVISIHIHHDLSNLSNTARLAAEAVKTIKVTVVEVGQLALGLGFMTMNAAEAAFEDQPIDQILALIKELEERTFIYAALDTVKYLKESGRVPGIVLKISNILRIKPIIQLHKGEVRLIGQVRTPTQVRSRLIGLLQSQEPLEQIAVLHTNAEEKARQLLKEVETDIKNNPDIWVSEATPVLGVQVGPGGIGFACVKAKS